jgi:hypothetical protein
MKTTKLIYFFTFLLLGSLFILALIYAPRGNEYKQWEKDMIKSNQLIK